MISISKEDAAQTDARLRTVIARSRLDILGDAHAFVDCSADAIMQDFRRGALALVRDREMWSQLVPCDDANAERFCVFSFHFPADIDNSGFVGWLATHLKRQLGTGVLVICGHNGKDGGIFDYWGVPLAMADDVIAAVRALMVGEGPPLRDGGSAAGGFSLAGVTMRPAAAAAAGAVSAATTFSFEQTADVFSARYRGGVIVDGYLIGRLEPDGAMGFRYVQADDTGRLDAGVSTGSLERLSDGRLRLIENFQWLTRDGSGQNVFEEF